MRSRSPIRYWEPAARFQPLSSAETELLQLRSLRIGGPCLRGGQWRHPGHATMMSEPANAASFCISMGSLPVARRGLRRLRTVLDAVCCFFGEGLAFDGRVA